MGARMNVALVVRPGTLGETGAAQVAQFTADWLNANGHCAGLSGDDSHDGQGYELKILESYVPPDLYLDPHYRRVYRLHCEVPFLAETGDEVARLADLLTHGVELAANSRRMLDALRVMFPAHADKLHLLPNLYPVPLTAPPRRPVDGDELWVGAFGAMRPMKNHLQSALLALHAARATGKRLAFHVNRPSFGDARAAPILANLKALFDANRPHELYVHPWLPRPQFQTLLRAMHVMMVHSLSETFSVVAADAVSQGVPLIASGEVPFTDLASLQTLMAAHEQAWREFLKGGA
jgi:hypothetical protein